ncbi:hypothetical protein [Sphingomonas koreensis]
MTPPPAFQQTVRRAPWALWTTLLAMLLAVQASAGAIRPAALIESGAVAAKLTLPAPLAAQFRETGHALKAAGQRLSAARPHDGQDGGAPPLPSHSLAVAAPAAQDDLRYFTPAVASRGDSVAGPYRARAPPLRA